MTLRLAALAALGPTEFDPGARESVFGELEQINRLSQEAMQKIADGSP